MDLDNAAAAFLLKHPEVRVVILRPVNVIGPSITNRISSFLRSKFCPYVMGYDPPLQFIHESDFARALRLSLATENRGIYNVAGEGVVPFTGAIRLAGSTPLPVPSLLAYPAAEIADRLGMSFPAHLVDYFRYPVVLSDQPFRRDFGFRSQVSTREALESLRATSFEVASPQKG